MCTQVRAQTHMQARCVQVWCTYTNAHAYTHSFVQLGMQLGMRAYRHGARSRTHRRTDTSIRAHGGTDRLVDWRSNGQTDGRLAGWRNRPVERQNDRRTTWRTDGWGSTRTHTRLSISHSSSLSSAPMCLHRLKHVPTGMHTHVRACARTHFCGESDVNVESSLLLRSAAMAAMELHTN